MPHSFGKNSLEKLRTCHKDLQLIAEESIKASSVDFGISEGTRSVERQQLLYLAGKSKIDGVKKRGKHNHAPSLAFDVFAFVNGKASWAEKDLCFIGGVITATAKRLYQEKKITHHVRWGGNWDGDGEIITDQSFIDLPHFELLNL